MVCVVIVLTVFRLRLISLYQMRCASVASKAFDKLEVVEGEVVGLKAEHVKN